MIFDELPLKRKDKIPCIFQEFTEYGEEKSKKTTINHTFI